MAKAKVMGLEAEIDRVFSRYESNLKKSIQEAIDEAEYEIWSEAEDCLQNYYNNFWPDTHKPKQYDRTESLKDSFVPYSNLIKDEKNNSWVASVGMGYDASRLDGVYSSEASPQYQPVDGSWVLDNYLKGIHPTTNGYPFRGDHVVYTEIIDEISPDSHMNEFLKKYINDFDRNVLKAIARRVTKGR